MYHQNIFIILQFSFDNINIIQVFYRILHLDFFFSGAFVVLVVDILSSLRCVPAGGAEDSPELSQIHTFKIVFIILILTYLSNLPAPKTLPEPSACPKPAFGDFAITLRINVSNASRTFKLFLA